MEAGGLGSGLSLPSARRTSRRPASGSIFAADEDATEEAVGRQIERHATAVQSDEKVAKIRDAALAEDPSVFDYDAHYDAIREARDGPKRQDRESRKSRYVETLLEKAKERKAERELMTERQRRLELEAEAHIYGTSESFVTASYKKKMEELRRTQAGSAQREGKLESSAAGGSGTTADLFGGTLSNDATSRSDGARREAADAPAPSSKAFPGEDVSKARRRASGDDARDLEEGEASRPGAHGDAPNAANFPRPHGSEPNAASLPRPHSSEPGARPGEPRSSGLGGRAAGSTPAAAPSLGSRRNDEASVAAARARYLARQRKRGPDWPIATAV